MKSHSPDALSLPSSQVSLPEGGYFSAPHLRPSASVSQHRSISPAAPADVKASFLPGGFERTDDAVRSQLSAQNTLIQQLFSKVTDLEAVLSQRLPAGAVSNASVPHSASRVSSAPRTLQTSPLSDAEYRYRIPPPATLPPPGFLPQPPLNAPRPLKGLVTGLTGLISDMLDGDGGGQAPLPYGETLTGRQRTHGTMEVASPGVGVGEGGVNRQRLDMLHSQIHSLQREAAELMNPQGMGMGMGLGGAGAMQQPVAQNNDLEALSVMRKETWESLENDVDQWKGKVCKGSKGFRSVFKGGGFFFDFIFFGRGMTWDGVSV